MTVVHSFLAVGLSLVGGMAEASEPLALGVHAGVAVPWGDDLRITTGSGPNLVFGIHGTWNITAQHALRPRAEYWLFSQGHQEVANQRIDTTVRSVALGGDYLFCPRGSSGRWAAGVGLYLLRWSVEGRNRLAFPSGGVAQAAGISSWVRPGFCLVATFRLTPRLEGEGRWISSRYGYEDLPANLGTLGLLWRF